MRVPGRFWAIGITTAVMAHAAIFTAIFWQPAESGARDAGRGGIEVSLGPASGSPGGAVDATGAPEVETIEPTEAPPASVPRESVTATAVEEADTSEPEAAGTQPVEAETAVRDQPDSIESRPVEAATMPQPEAATDEPVDQAGSQTAEPVEATEPAQEPDVTTDVPPNAEQVAKSAPSTAGTSGDAGAGSAADAGRAEHTSSGGTPGADADYMARLSAWLEKHKRYPRRAQMRRQEGTALLRFVIDRQGRVVEYSIRESSGHDILDEEVAAMIERAQPLPGIPEDMHRGRLELVVPVQFFLM